jgi:hypothetical protein
MHALLSHKRVGVEHQGVIEMNVKVFLLTVAFVSASVITASAQSNQTGSAAPGASSNLSADTHCLDRTTGQPRLKTAETGGTATGTTASGTAGTSGTTSSGTPASGPTATGSATSTTGSSEGMGGSLESTAGLQSY